jgi:hypothetical protein
LQNETILAGFVFCRGVYDRPFFLKSTK